MVEIITWDRGDTIRINNIYTDISDAAYDPTTIELKIYDPTGSVNKTVTYAASEIIRSAEGIYYYDFDIPTDAIIGSWIIKFIGVSSGFNDVSKDQFSIGDSEEKLYCTYKEVQNRAGISDDVAVEDEIIPFIKDSMGEIDEMYGKSFSYGNEITDWFDTNRADPKIMVDTINLRYTPILSITSIEEYDLSGDLVDTHISGDYWINEKTGRVSLYDDTFVKQKHRVKVIYTYGYETIPKKINSLCAIISAMRLLIHQVGGTYDDVTSWNAAGLSIGVGEPYMNMSKAVEMLNKEATRIMGNIGRLRPSAIVL